jgi:N6-adenosine-specific RNA methylase IME4
MGRAAKLIPFAQQAIHVYGKLQEGMHIAGYTFERACSNLEWILKEDRWKLDRFADVNAFLDSLHLDEFQHTLDQKKRIGKLIKDLQPKVSNRQIAKTVGIGTRTADRMAAPRGASESKKGNKNKQSEKPTAPSGAPTEYSGAKAAQIVERRTTDVATTQARRADKEQRLGEKIAALPDAKFGVIVADPEWHDEVYSEQTGMNRHASRHYVTSDLETIKARPVASIAADDCVLFLWSTNQHLDVAIDVLRTWGFEYASHYIWRKPTPGLGYWNRSVHEVLLIGTRGNVPCPALGTQKLSVIDADRGEHSAKPDIFLEMIEGYFPSLPKIELNRRGPPRPGWSAWGNEVLEAAQ